MQRLNVWNVYPEINDEIEVHYEKNIVIAKNDFNVGYQKVLISI